MCCRGATIGSKSKRSKDRCLKNQYTVILLQLGWLCSMLFHPSGLQVARIPISGLDAIDNNMMLLRKTRGVEESRSARGGPRPSRLSPLLST
eukprot:scaffold16150_cov126-Skeletonema_dohrnii-CCMP3373.AAC.2